MIEHAAHLISCIYLFCVYVYTQSNTCAVSHSPVLLQYPSLLVLGTDVYTSTAVIQGFMFSEPETDELYTGIQSSRVLSYYRGDYSAKTEGEFGTGSMSLISR